jgi:D-glycero-alpha-D-manno-heptose 1-phosphate guanylyltransferase
MEAVILAGGFGTRLKHIVSDIPKPMANVCGKPFLTYVLEYLRFNGINKVVMAVGYKHQVIVDYFNDTYKEIKIRYSYEDIPLFTGGAIKQALNECNTNDVFIINGDTFFDVDLKEMKLFHKNNHSMLTIASKKMYDFERYGSLIINNNKITSFREKQFTNVGYINGGIYLLNKNLFDDVSEKKFSFEKDIMEKKVNKIDIFSFESKGYFIDIGIPEDYYKAQLDFRERFYE